MRFEFGAYTLTVPFGVRVHAELNQNDNTGSTIWTIPLGRYQVRVWLSTTGKLGDLGDSILTSTKQWVETERLEVRGIPGESFGDLAIDRRTDWWFRKGEMMIYISLTGPPITSKRDKEMIDDLIQSLRYEG
jgi:hypothetical protein